jgi:hypothetical protein
VSRSVIDTHPLVGTPTIGCSRVGCPGFYQISAHLWLLDENEGVAQGQGDMSEARVRVCQGWSDGPMTGLGGTEPGQGQGVQSGLGGGRELHEGLGQVAVQVQKRVREQFPRVEAAAVSGQDAAEQARVASRDQQADRDELVGASSSTAPRPSCPRCTSSGADRRSGREGGEAALRLLLGSLVHEEAHGTGSRGGHRGCRSWHPARRDPGDTHP